MSEMWKFEKHVLVRCFQFKVSQIQLTLFPQELNSIVLNIYYDLKLMYFWNKIISFIYLYSINIFVLLSFSFSCHTSTSCYLSYSFLLISFISTFHESPYFFYTSYTRRISITNCQDCSHNDSNTIGYHNFFRKLCNFS